MPQFWRVRSNTQRSIAYDQLRHGATLWQMPDWWRDEHYSNRWCVIRWMQREGFLTDDQVEALVTPQRQISKWREDNPAIIKAWKDFEHDPGRTHWTSEQADTFNKGRMLSAQYTHLTDRWRRGDGNMVQPVDMNDGHLENGLKLLNESHGNIVAKACEMIGAIHAQFHAVTGIREYTESLCIQLQKVDVGTLYPVFEPMAEELKKRREAVRPPICDTIDMFNSLMDQEIAGWGVKS